MTRERIATTTADKRKGRFPEFAPRDDMQNPIYLHDPAHMASLRIHFGNSERTLVMGEVPVARSAGQRGGVRIPDLLIAFGVDRAGIIERRGYAIDREGKPPDFALEVASPTTGVTDYTEKRGEYEAYGIGEYWRFDPTGGQYHDVALAGDRLVDGRYSPITVQWSGPTHCRGYSAVLDLYLCWEEGRLRWYDPKSGAYLRTFDEETAARQAETTRADRETAAREAETTRADRETAAREEAEAEVRRLRQRLEQLGEADK